MGVVNLTPDSFYTESRSMQLDVIMKKVAYMVDNQVDILDLGAMSSRPGAEIISPAEELKRLKPSFEMIRKAYPDLIISIDTVHSAVAEDCLSNGADMINDISAGTVDEGIFEIANKYSAYYCLMHMQNIPKNMQEKPSYNDVTLDIFTFLKKKCYKLKNMGLDKLIIDPGFGFGKSIVDNYKLLNELEVFKILELPILVGLSRKSMIYKPLEISPEESLAATTAAHLVALQNGATILRVHDVKEAKQAVKMYELLSN